MNDDLAVPDGFSALSGAGAFVDHVGPLYAAASGVLGVRVRERHLNVAGMAQGGFLATLVDVALGRAIREDADAERVATVSLTTDYIGPFRRARGWRRARRWIASAAGSPSPIARCAPMARRRFGR